MIVDSSALMAIILAEPEAEHFLHAMAGAENLSISAASLVETRIVAESRRGVGAVALLEELLADLEIDIVAFDEDQANIATTAWQRFGKGHHSAALNFGDTFSYALAKSQGEPLLFKGTGFTQTDLASVF